MGWKAYATSDRKLFTDGTVSFYMIKVPGGEFFIGETPVTQQLWEAVMDKNRSHFTDSIFAPVENVSHKDCEAFIERLNSLTGETFRLPSMKEWVLAARGGVNGDSFIYAGSNDPEEVGWFNRKTMPVRLKKPNKIGLFDMTGNVWEWCDDVAPVKRVMFLDTPTERVELPNGEIIIPTYYYLKGGSIVNGYSTSTIGSTNSFGEYYRNAHLGMRLAL